MPEYFDPMLERLLVDTLTERADRVPATVTLERVHARLAERGSVRSRLTVRRPLALLGLAAALMLPLAAFVAGQRPTEPPPDPAGQYQALIRRSDGDVWAVVAMRGDGQERVITSVPVPDLDDERSWPPLAVSEGGWLAVPGATGWDFRDLRSPERAIGPIAPYLADEYGRGSSGGRAWVDGDRYVTWNERGEVQLFDPAAATVERHKVPRLRQGVEAWTSDGSMLLLHDSQNPVIYRRGERRPAVWRTVALADENGRGGEVATLSDLDLGWRRAGLWWREDGSRVQLCDMAVGRECPGLPNGSVVVEDPSGSLATWYTGGPATDDVVDAVFGATGLWILLDRRSGGRQVAVAHVPTPGDARTVAAWEGSPDATRIEAVASDDSLVVVESRLIDTRSGRTTSIDGDLLGFVPSTTADTWPGAAFQAGRPVASAPPSQLTPYPTLRPLDDVLAEQLGPADRLLWREEHAAADGPGASPTTLEIGPIELKEGLGVLLYCSGPSDVLVTMAGVDAKGRDLDPLLSRCLGGAEDGSSEIAPSRQIDGPVRFFVTTSPDTAWQLVVFDPAPPGSYE